MSVRAPEPAFVFDPATRGWERDRWYSYLLKLTASVSFGDAPAAFDFDLDGLVQIVPTDVTADATTFYMGLANPKIVSRIPESQRQLDRVAAQLEKTGCFIKMSGGRVEAMWFPPGLEAMAANTYRSIASALQFAHTTPTVDHYAVNEYDSTGQYAADYSFDGDRSMWSKRKARYNSILSASAVPMDAPGHVVPHIDDSQGSVLLSPQGRPETVTLLDRVTINGGQQPVHSTTSLSLRSGPTEAKPRADLQWDELLGGMKRVAASEPYGVAPSVEALDNARINGMTFDTAVAQLEQYAKDAIPTNASSVNGARLDSETKAAREKQTAGESHIFGALAAILREQPKTVPEAVQRIQANSPAANFLIEALGSASTPATQSALLQLERSPGTGVERRRRIIMALSRTPRPDQKSIDAMKAMLIGDPFSEPALLALGTYARRLRESGDTERAEDIGRLLLDRLVKAKNTPDTMTALRAITNAGYDPALSEVMHSLDSPQYEVRIDAVRALQSMHDPKVDAVIAERLRTDPSPDVRISALGAAKVRDPSDTLTQAVESAATEAEDPHVRYRAVELLSDWMARRPDVRGTLEKVASRDSEVRIRERALSAL